MTTECGKDVGSLKEGFQKPDGCNSKVPEEILPLQITYLTPALVEEARTQLHETDEVKTKCLEELRKMIEAEKNLLTPTDDLFLLAFLRARKYNVKKAFKLLQNYWSFRREYSKIYNFSDYDSTKSLIMRSFLGILEHRDRTGCLVLLAKVGLWDPEKDSYDEIFRALSGILVYSLEHEATQIAGIRVIFDLRGITWTQLKFGTPGNILLMVRSSQFCFPARFKGIHVISPSKLIHFVWSLTYPFLTSKLKKRIFFHGEDLKPLLEYIHPSVLPEELGGQAPRFNNDRWGDTMESRKDIVMSQLNYGYKN